MDKNVKNWIDTASYETMLERWRFAISGDPMFQGEVGEYYAKVMFAKRVANQEEAVQASKNIGWDR